MKFVTAKQAADLTGISERTIRRHIARGRIQARKVTPNRYQIALEDLPVRKESPLQTLRAEIEDLRRRVDELERERAITML